MLIYVLHERCSSWEFPYAELMTPKAQNPSPLDRNRPPQNFTRQAATGHGHCHGIADLGLIAAVRWVPFQIAAVGVWSLWQPTLWLVCRNNNKLKQEATLEGLSAASKSFSSTLEAKSPSHSFFGRRESVLRRLPTNRKWTWDHVCLCQGLSFRFGFHPKLIGAALATYAPDRSAFLGLPYFFTGSPRTQRLQNPLIKEYTWSNIRDPHFFLRDIP